MYTLGSSERADLPLAVVIGAGPVGLLAYFGVRVMVVQRLPWKS